MKNLLICLCFSCFSLGISAQTDIAKAISALLAETPIATDLQELCDDIGGRVTGSKANEASVEWGLKKFQEAGVKAWKAPFEMPVLWLPKSTSATISGDINFVPQVVAKYQSPARSYNGKIVYLGMGQKADFENQEAQVKGNFVLVESDLCLDVNGLFAEYTAANETELLARKMGAQGIIFMASRPSGLLYRFITNQTTANDMPQLVMAREDAKRCIRVIENGKSLNIDLKINAETGGQFISNNVIAEITGSEKPEEVIIIGAHLDSWALGTGANDNGCNVSMMIDIARTMKKLNIQPKRTIRFALWNGEEQGYFGSWAYTKKHSKAMDEHIMAISVDIGSGDIVGFFTNGRDELIPAVDQLLKPVQALSDFTNLNAPIVGTDNFDFMLEGVPNLVAIHKPASYGTNYHAASDTFDKVDIKALKRNSAIIATLLLGLANDGLQWPRQSRAEIQAMFDRFDLEYTMRMFNVWEGWISGERGRN